MIFIIRISLFPIIISFVLGPSFVLSYDVGFQIYSYIPAMVSVAAYPIWPAVSSAIARKQFDWVRRIYIKGGGLVLMVSIVVSLVVFFEFDHIVKLWINKSIHLPQSVLIGFFIYSILASYGLFQAMFLNGINKINEQVNIYVFYIFALIILKISSLIIFDLGFFGLIMMTNVMYCWRIYRSHRLAMSFNSI